MAYTDYIRDHVRIDQAVSVNDGRLGSTTTWLAIRTMPCRAFNMSSRANDVYHREGITNFVRMVFDTKMVRADGSLTLDHLIQKEGESRYRFVYQGKVMKPFAIHHQSMGLHDYAKDYINVDCEYDVEDVGYVDS